MIFQVHAPEVNRRQGEFKSDGGGRHRGQECSKPQPAQIRIPENRRPRNPKSEIPNQPPIKPGHSTVDQAIFGFRVSAFLRPSVFGLRISATAALSRCTVPEPATCRASRSSQYAGLALACATVVSSVSACACVKNAPCSRAGADHAGQADAGNLQLAAAPRDLAHALAHQRRAINGALPGDHQIRRAQTPLQRRLPGKQIKPRLQLRAQKCQQAKPQPARGAGARLAREIAPELPLNARAPTGPGNARPARNPAGASPFCGP